MNNLIPTKATYRIVDQGQPPLQIHYEKISTDDYNLELSNDDVAITIISNLIGWTLDVIDAIENEMDTTQVMAEYVYVDGDGEAMLRIIQTRSDDERPILVFVPYNGDEFSVPMNQVPWLFDKITLISESNKF